MKTLRKKLTCYLLAILFCTGMICTVPALVHAESKIVYQTTAPRIAYADTPVREEFTAPQSSIAVLVVNTVKPVGFTMTLYDSDNSVFATNHFTADDPSWREMSEDFYYPCGTNLPKGKYSAELTFDDDTIYLFYVTVDTEPNAIISQQKLPLTIGFSKTLKVTGNSGKVTWKSSNSSVASVDRNGKVTAKKKGKCTITATVDKQNLKCSVTVQTNKYSFMKFTNSQIQDKKAAVNTYSASFDSSGNLKLKIQFINNSGNFARYLQNLQIKIKNSDNKTILTHKVSRVNVAIPDQDKKDFTVTIPKSKVKGKKIDLRNVVISANGKYIYHY